EKYADQTRGGGDTLGTLHWGDFLAPGGDNLKWDDLVAIGGHSNGSKLSAWIASEEAVYRAFFFSGPNEDVDEYSPSWLYGMATTYDRMYAFSHTYDENFHIAYPNWLTMGLRGQTGWPGEPQAWDADLDPALSPGSAQL